MKNFNCFFVTFYLLAIFFLRPMSAVPSLSLRAFEPDQRSALELVIASLGQLDFSRGSLNLDGSAFILRGSLDPSKIDIGLFEQGLALIKAGKRLDASSGLDNYGPELSPSKACRLGRASCRDCVCRSPASDFAPLDACSLGRDYSEDPLRVSSHALASYIFLEDTLAPQVEVFQKIDVSGSCDNNLIGVYAETFHDRDSSVLIDSSAIVTRNVCFDAQKSIECHADSFSPEGSHGFSICTQESELSKRVKEWNVT